MIIFATMTIGFLLGLAYFGGLWLSVRRLLHIARRPPVLDASRALRLGLFALAVAVLMKVTGAYALGILPGFWLARWSTIRSVREARHG